MPIFSTLPSIVGSINTYPYYGSSTPPASTTTNRSTSAPPSSTWKQPFTDPWFSRSVGGGGGGGTQSFRNISIISNKPPPRPPLPAGTVPYADLANLVNQFMTMQADMPLKANLPGYTGMRDQQSKNVLSALQGDVPQDVITQILQQAAERGIMTGAPGGPNANSAYLRALGLTSLGQMKTGEEGLSRMIADTPVPEIWNPMSLYVPEYLANLELEQATGAGSGGTGGPRGVTRTPWNSYLFPQQNQGNQTPLGTLPGWA